MTEPPQVKCGWDNKTDIQPYTYNCSFCGDKVAASKGWHGGGSSALRNYFIAICPSCTAPTFFADGKRYPGFAPGRKVWHIEPAELEDLYHEARKCAAASAHTAAVMVCRKILMHIAVSKGADGGLSFVKYVEYLEGKGYIPPDGKGWVDYIRQRGNEANHEIALMTEKDSSALIKFVEMLLTFIYEFAKAVPTVTQPGAPPAQPPQK